MNKWYKEDGKELDLVLSSSISLVRNIANTPFSSRLTNDARKNICKKIYAAIQNSSLAGEFNLIELDKISNMEKLALVEKGIISSDFSKEADYCCVLISRDESVSIMLCGSEHINIWCRGAGECLDKLYKKINVIDDVFIKSIPIAFDQELGFLTSTPMKLGTGMRAGYVVHIAAMEDSGLSPQLNNMLTKLGFSLNSVFMSGGFYQLSNEITLGITEASAIENLKEACRQIAQQERELRNSLFNDSSYEDKIYRAIGTMSMARQISINEMFELISYARLGVFLGGFDKNYQAFSELMYTSGNATIMLSDKTASQSDVNRIRAEYIRNKLK